MTRTARAIARQFNLVGEVFYGEGQGKFGWWHRPPNKPAIYLGRDLKEVAFNARQLPMFPTKR